MQLVAAQLGKWFSNVDMHVTGVRHLGIETCCQKGTDAPQISQTLLTL